MPPRYRHTQASPFAALVVVSLVALLVILLVEGGSAVPFTLLIPVLIFIHFISLTVAVDGEKVSVRMGPGLLRYSYPLDKIENCRIVQNSPMNSLGIRWTGNGWLVAVWGLYSVELELEDGSAARIGTDEPEKLARAIEEALMASRQRLKHSSAH